MKAVTSLPSTAVKSMTETVATLAELWYRAVYLFPPPMEA